MQFINFDYLMNIDVAQFPDDQGNNKLNTNEQDEPFTYLPPEERFTCKM